MTLLFLFFQFYLISNSVCVAPCVEKFDLKCSGKGDNQSNFRQRKNAENIEKLSHRKRQTFYTSRLQKCSIEKIPITLKSMIITKRKIEKKRKSMENRYERTERSEKDSLHRKRRKWKCSGKYKQARLSVYVARMSNGYCKSFPSVRALANIANATVHFRNADDLSRKVPVSPLGSPFSSRRATKVLLPRIRISIIDLRLSSFL